MIPADQTRATPASFADAVDLILEEKRRTLHHIDPDACERVIRAIIAAPRVFVHGEGRSGLVVRMFAMRLMHLGKVVFVVGETTTPAIAARDVLVAISGSGTTAGVLEAAHGARRAGASVCAVTTDPDSPLAQDSDLLVVVPAAAKTDLSGRLSLQFSGSLFEQSALVLFDATFLLMQSRLGRSSHELWSRHANLE